MLSSGSSTMAAMIIGGTFPSYSIFYCFAVCLVTSFIDVISNIFISGLNDRSSIALKFCLLWDVSAAGDIFNCGGILYFTSSNYMNLHFSLQIFLLLPFYIFILCLVSLLMGEVFYLLPLPYLFLSMFIHIWIHIPVLYISQEGVPLVVSMQRFLVTYTPWSLLATWTPILALWTLFLCLYFLHARKGFVCRTQCMFHLLVSLLHFLACVGRTTVPFPLWNLVSRGDPIFFAIFPVGLFHTALPGFISIYRYFLAHESHPSYLLGFYIW